MEKQTKTAVKTVQRIHNEAYWLQCAAYAAHVLDDEKFTELINHTTKLIDDYAKTNGQVDLPAES